MSTAQEKLTAAHTELARTKKLVGAAAAESLGDDSPEDQSTEPETDSPDDEEKDEEEGEPEPTGEEKDELATAGITEADLLGEIAEAEVFCAKAEIAVDSAKLVLKEAKAEYDGCVLKLRRLAKAIQNDQDRPLFDSAKDSQEESKSDDGDDSDSSYEDCLGAEIGVLGLQPSVVTKLNETGVWTIGDLETLRKEILLGKAKWPKGIGPAKVTVIEEAGVEYIAKNYQEDTEGETEVNDNGEETEDKED